MSRARIWPLSASGPTRDGTSGLPRPREGGAGRGRLRHRSPRLAWEQSGLPVVAQQVGADVIHLPYYSMPLRPGRPTVVTVHDVTYFTEPSLHAPGRAMLFKAAIRTAARRATRLIVPSGATRDELVRELGVDA